MTKLRFKGAILLAVMSICSLSFLNVRQAMAFNNPFRISFFNSDENGESEGGESESESGESEGESESEGGGDSNIRPDHELKKEKLTTTEFKTEIGSNGITIEYKRSCETLVLFCGYERNKTCYKDSEKVISSSCGNWEEKK